tara:strand:- start:283 stop:918 length:636 start_codon:yes stop_codon:yes gene_type:complete
MAITYPLSIPDTTSFSQINMMAKTTVGVTESPFNQKVQVQKWAGEYWEADIVLKPMKRADAEYWISFMIKLKGSYGTFLINPDVLGNTARGSCATSAGTPVVNGAHAAQSNTLNITGAPSGATNYFKAGDYFSIGSGSSTRLFKVLDDASSNGSGELVVNIFPQLRTALSGSETITVSNPKGKFRLASNEMRWQVSTVSMYGMGFTAIEAL